MAVFSGITVAENGILLGGGLNMSSLAMSEDIPGVDIGMRMGFSVGAGYEIGINDMFSLIPGIAYETRGATLEAEFMGVKIEGTSKLAYIEIPVLAQLNFPAGPGIFNIFAGPELGILLSNESETDGETVDNKDASETLDVALAVGAGFEIPAGPGAVAIRPSYSLGLLQANKAEDGDGDLTVKNRNIKIAVAYKINM